MRFENINDADIRTWECNVSREIETQKQLSVLDGFSANRQTALKIIDDVRRQGDGAIVKYSKRFDGVSLSPDKFQVKTAKLKMHTEKFRSIRKVHSTGNQ